MELEKILSLVAVVVYGLVSIVLSVVRTLKTSKISSEVKSAFPLLGKGEKDDVQPPDDDAVEQSSADEICSLDELISALSDFMRENYTDK